MSNGDLHGLPLDGLTDFVLANIQVFRGKWVRRFDPMFTKADTFRGRSGHEPIEMMSEAGVFGLHESSLGQTVTIEYAGPYRLLLFLPKNESDRPLMTFLRQGLYVQLPPTGVVIDLPQLHLNTSEILTTPLEELGVRAAFGANADFSPILGTRGSRYAVMFQDVSASTDHLRLRSSEPVTIR